MQNEKTKISKYIKFVVVISIVLFLFLYVLVVQINHHGKIKTVLVAIPNDSQIMVDGNKNKAGAVYLKAGNHTFVATRQYFDDFRTSENVQSPKTIYLLPAPTSQQAIQFLQKNPSVQAEREAFGALEDQRITQQMAAQSPLVKLLPHTDINGPFSIGYGASKEGGGKTYLIISDSSPNGRSKALQWIREHGSDPTDLEIQFTDFVNPLTMANAR